MREVRIRLMLSVVAVVIGLWVSAAPALINADFTPIDIVENATLVLELRLAPGAKAGEVKVTVKRALVGKVPDKPPVLDITRGPKKAHLKMIAQIIAALGDAPAVMFVGADEQGEEAAWMHLGGKWVDLYTEDSKLFEADQINARMEGTWAGSTDMLLKCIQYIQRTEEPDVPVRTGAEWGEAIPAGKIDGKVVSATAVDLTGDGAWALHLASVAGDKLLVYDKAKKAFTDVTAARKLPTRSLVSTWTDGNADGRLDLISWDGKTLTAYLQGKDGAFTSEEQFKLKGGCLSVSALDVGSKFGPGLLVGSAKAPQLVGWDENGKAVIEALLLGEADVKKLGKGGGCLVGDLDGDAWADVLQLFEKGGLFYKATAPGKFAPAAATPIALGPGRSGAVLGDWAGDGRLDVFAAATDGCRLWHNRGKMEFLEKLGRSGEIAYISQPFGFAGQPCDVNNDGRQDVLIVYASRSPHIFFNRGYRSFGHSHQLDLEQQALLAEASEGIQTGCIADFTGDGAQDMAVVLNSGKVVVFPRDVVDTPACIRASLPLGGTVGPVVVTGYAGKRCLGAWNVAAGTNEAFFGHERIPQITLKWTFPGGKEQTQVVKVGKKPVRVMIKPK